MSPREVTAAAVVLDESENIGLESIENTKVDDHLRPPKQSVNIVHNAIAMLQNRPDGDVVKHLDMCKSMKNMNKSRSDLLVVAQAQSVDDKSVIMKPTSVAEAQSHSEHSEFMVSIKQNEFATK